MGQRLLNITAELLQSVITGLQAGPPRYWEVVADPLPTDAKIVSVCSSVYYPNMVEIVLESPNWAAAPPRTRVNPVFKVVPAECPA